MSRSSRETRLILLLVLAMVTWGLSWTNAKVLGTYAPAVVLVFWRFLFAALTMVPVLVFFKQKLSISRKGFFFSLAGAVCISLYNLLFFVGTHLGSAGIGGVIVPAMNPILAFMGAVIIFRQDYSKIDILGLFLGLIGGSIVLRVWDFSFEQITNSGNIYFILASACWAVLTLISSRTHAFIQTLTFSFWVYFLSAVFFFPFVIGSSGLSIFFMDWIFWIHMLFVSIGAMVFATTVYFFGTVALGSDKASAFIFIVPVSAILFSIILLDEPLESSTAVGGTLAMSAVYLINKKPK